MKLTIGSPVLYTLTPEDVAEINHRRTDERTVRYYRNRDRWPMGVQAHVGNPVTTGQVLPAVVVVVNSEEGPKVEEVSSANLQVFLDGSDVYWVEDKKRSDDSQPGTWSWPQVDEQTQTKQSKNK